jgi:hypothetical protein
MCAAVQRASCTPVSWEKKVFCIDFLHISLDKSQKIKGGHILLRGQNSRSLFWTLFLELISNVNKEYICSYLYLTICGACDQGFLILKSLLKLETIFEEQVYWLMSNHNAAILKYKSLPSDTISEHI